MANRLETFFSNGGYATWAQTVFVVISVGVAALALRHTDQNAAVSNSLSFGQKYFLDSPSPSAASLRLRIAQFTQVQKAKESISNYDAAKDKDFEQLFSVARPLVATAIYQDQKLVQDFTLSETYFSSMMLCVASEGCDKETAKKLLADEMLGFYNATCPYMEWQLCT